MYSSLVDNDLTLMMIWVNLRLNMGMDFLTTWRSYDGRKLKLGRSHKIWIGWSIAIQSQPFALYIPPEISSCKKRRRQTCH